MARSQPYTVACDGGLVTASNQIDLLKTPGVATELKNFEVSINSWGTDTFAKRGFCRRRPKVFFEVFHRF